MHFPLLSVLLLVLMVRVRALHLHGTQDKEEQYNQDLEMRSRPRLWDWDDEDDIGHCQLLKHVGRMLMESNLTTNSSLIVIPWHVDDVGKPGALVTVNSVQANSNISDTSPGALLAEIKDAALDPFMTVVNIMGLNVSDAMMRYYRVRATRIMLLLSDIAWLVFAAAGFMQRVFALLGPLVKVGQTGQLTINAASFLSLAQLVADVVARFADLISKIFLVIFRGIILATTLPPVNG